MRRDDWLDRLSAVIDAHDAQPFEWGRSDCFAFVMDAVEAMTGSDPYAKERRVSSEAEAKASLRARGFVSVDAALRAAFPRIPPAMAGTGDIAVVLTDRRRMACGVVVGPSILARDQDRLARLPLSTARRVYHID